MEEITVEQARDEQIISDDEDDVLAPPTSASPAVPVAVVPVSAEVRANFALPSATRPTRLAFSVVFHRPRRSFRDFCPCTISIFFQTFCGSRSRLV